MRNHLCLALEALGGVPTVEALNGKSGDVAGAESRVDLSLNLQRGAHSRLFLKTKNLTDTTQRELYGNKYDQAKAPLRFRKREDYGCTAVAWIRCSI